MAPLSADALLALPVRLDGIELGRPVDVYLDLGSGRVLGFEVHCGDDTRRFLPLAAARLGGDEIAIASALTLVDELSFYRGRATSLRELRGRRVEEAGYPVGPLRDVVFGAGGAIAALVVEGDLEPVSIPFGAGVRVARGERSAPAA